jgi:hypothetical protein
LHREIASVYEQRVSEEAGEAGGATGAEDEGWHGEPCGHLHHGQKVSIRDEARHAAVLRVLVQDGG